MDVRSMVSGSALKQALEGRDGKALADFYADDAVIKIIDRNNTPSRPRQLSGRSEISAYWDDVCGRAMTHEVGPTIANGDQMAFTEACAYPDGTKVFCATVLELRDGTIANQTIVQAWDD